LHVSNVNHRKPEVFGDLIIYTGVGRSSINQRQTNFTRNGLALSQECLASILFDRNRDLQNRTAHLKRRGWGNLDDLTVRGFSLGRYLAVEDWH
jgi:hypothetical protein